MTTVSSNYAIKSDIFAALNYTQCFLKYSEEAQEFDDVWGDGPHDFVAGMHTAFYKDLGNSSAVMNLSFINLPRWMNVQDTDDVQKYRKMIAEHLQIAGGLDEERSEGYQLLQHYRDFLSAHDFTAFFDFTAKYPSYLLNALAKEHYWVKPLSTTNLKELLMRNKQELTPIIQSEGFQNIARAIRQSTVTLQYMAKSGRQHYDIRYGLGQELRRKANYPDEFIQELGEFLHSFNAENARVAEDSSKRHWRKSVREGDITEIVQLIDRYGPQTVCHLLVAFGYALTSHDEAPTDDATSHTPTRRRKMSDKKAVYSLTICGKATIDMHSLNNEGSEGNQIATRMVNVYDQTGKLAAVNAISGDMFKHIQAEHLFHLSRNSGLKLCSGCQRFNANRILDDDTFLNSFDKNTPDNQIITTMVQTCAIDDIEGILVTAKNKSTPRKSIVEFGWVVGIPEFNTTDNYFHVKYVSDSGAQKRR